MADRILLGSVPEKCTQSRKIVSLIKSSGQVEFPGLAIYIEKILILTALFGLFNACSPATTAV